MVELKKKRSHVQKFPPPLHPPPPPLHLPLSPLPPPTPSKKKKEKKMNPRDIAGNAEEDSLRFNAVYQFARGMVISS